MVSRENSTTAHRRRLSASYANTCRCLSSHPANPTNKSKQQPLQVGDQARNLERYLASFAICS
jgi:hypothetical protein